MVSIDLIRYNLSIELIGYNVYFSFNYNKKLDIQLTTSCITGNKIRNYRIKVNLSQKDISKLFGMGLIVVAAFENGSNIESLKRYSKYPIHQAFI